MSASTQPIFTAAEVVAFIASMRLAIQAGGIKVEHLQAIQARYASERITSPDRRVYEVVYRQYREACAMLMAECFAVQHGGA